MFVNKRRSDYIDFDEMNRKSDKVKINKLERVLINKFTVTPTHKKPKLMTMNQNYRNQMTNHLKPPIVPRDVEK